MRNPKRTKNTNAVTLKGGKKSFAVLLVKSILNLFFFFFLPKVRVELIYLLKKDTFAFFDYRLNFLATPAHF